MRIIYFSRAYSPHDHRFLAALARSRHDVFFLQLEGGQPEIRERPLPAEIRQIAWEGGRHVFHWRDVPRLTMDLKRVIGEVGPDLIHAGPIQTCAFLTVLSGFRPVLTMSWGFDLMQDADRNAWWRWVTRYTLQRTTFFASDAYVTRDRAVALGMNPDRTVVFPWGVNLNLFRPSPPSKKPGVRSEIGRHRESTPRGRAVRGRRHFVLLCNRSWEPRYGVDVLARAFVQAAQANPAISLILLGGGSQAKSIREIFTRGGMLGRVQFCGRVPQAAMPRWYRMADLFVSPSHVDGSSVSLMEALACGLPPLISDIPANKEWVREDANGWLFPDGNAQALADKILSVAANRRELARIGRRARKTAEERADWSKNFPVLLQAYKDTIQLNGIA